ncbi:hypothetical protein E8E13_000686 [Curvularia kusanoi]|uniref:Myb-like domain-containing protein n=1 Tax=Curvularia kusanoi TaxID=90978 RepID=A0A9P4W2A2_CURKU|nr:hypothetical protein E8E13_000686 [Curvularia kusanoi]
MTDPTQRRISKAFLLGFSDKPFIDTSPPKPRRSSGFTTAAKTHPGGLIEWAASDGRRGRLSGSGKARTLAAEEPGRAASKKESKAASKKDEVVDGGVLGVGGIFEGWPATGSVKHAAQSNKPAQSVKAAQSEKPAPSVKPAQSVKPAESVKPVESGWTEGQDKKLIEFKSDAKLRSWREIAGELDKEMDECKERFTKIKPKDWRPPPTSSKKEKGKQGQYEKKQNENKEEEKKNEMEVPGWGDMPFDVDNGGGNNDTWKNDSGGCDGEWSKNDDNAGGAFDGDQADGWGVVDNKSEKKDSNAGAWDWGGTDDKAADNKVDGGFEGDNAWGNNTGNDGANDVTTWQMHNEPKNPSHKSASNKAVSNKPVSNRAQSNKAPSRKSSHKHSSKHPEHKHSSKNSDRRSSNPAPPQTVYELKPDDTFSASDLRLIARILQQDTNMVWDRLSWRFRDKTGRNLHADVFEEKVTGGLERRNSTE